MSKVVITHAESEVFVAEQRAKGSDVSWDGWTMVFWKANPNGVNDKHGALKNGRWGIQARVDIEDTGDYRVPIKYIATRRKGA